LHARKVPVPFRAPRRSGMFRSMVLAIIAVVLLVAVALWLLLTYNGLVRRRLRVDNAWSQIDVVLRQRHDLVPGIVQIVRDHTSYERGIVEDVSAARERAVSAGGVAETAKAERELTEGVGKLLAVAEAYPDLKASQSFVTFQVQLADLETRIAVARQVYNDTVQTYNEMVQTLPTALVARSMGFETRAFFDITPTERVAPPVAV